ncbi:hypothetical protein SAMN04489859_10652 [Paracoccus alcaliphilus]|uniref:Uncharacterized protein n=1 Tax=Paracoccus alcaliphilus TaxID=34002 RepID=A0A1H8NM98_9RHOB|nr:hypothetical protein [Paracoccus alcaliphilus]WCR17494.1 hypothetical protein JHW40_14320 [Paracoccus alcaliphilus]SEO30724.1 hypothetical protein SAMN04489859_10652 [Paracoccus alcaliphilus]
MTAIFFLLSVVLIVCAIIFLWRLAPLLAAAFILLALPVSAAGIGAIANPIIDTAQVQIVTWIVGGVMSAGFAALSWFGSKIGIRLVERLNRQTIEESATRYANSIIDLLQARYLGATTIGQPDLSDLIRTGISYIKTGNPGTVKATGITDDRIGTYVRDAIQQVKSDKLADALAKAGAL